MRIESKLCHISDNKAIVQATGWINDKAVGSALAEGSTVEIAEDKAITRLNKRINAITNNEPSLRTTQLETSKTKIKVELPNSDKKETIKINNEPSDWSNELTAIDSEIQRLNWSRDNEIKFLEKNLGYNNRNKITSYSDILKYLSLLKNIEKNVNTENINRNIKTLIEDSDIILRDLSWDHIQGREYLKKEFNVSSRKELNEKQLISFIQKLKTIQNQNNKTNPTQFDK